MSLHIKRNLIFEHVNTVEFWSFLNSGAECALNLEKVIDNSVFEFYGFYKAARSVKDSPCNNSCNRPYDHMVMIKRPKGPSTYDHKS